jgi:hypothetical protein
METENEWGALVKRLSDVKTEQYKKDFIVDLIRGTVTGEYQWDDRPDRYNDCGDWMYTYRFTVYFRYGEGEPLRVRPNKGKSIPYEIFETDRKLLRQAIDIQMVKREEQRVKSTLPMQSVNLKKKFFLWLVSLIKILGEKCARSSQKRFS